MAERFELPVDGPDRWIGALMYLCLLTYPKQSDQPKRDRLYRAFCSYRIRTARYRGCLTKGGPQFHSALLKSVPQQQMLNSLNASHRQIALRLLAAEKFLFSGTMQWSSKRKVGRRPPFDVQRDKRWLRDRDGARPQGFHGGWKWNEQARAYEGFVETDRYESSHRVPSVNDIVRAISTQIEMHERNVWREVLAPARYAIHMAEGLRCTTLESLDTSKPPDPTLPMGFDLLALLRDPTWVTRATKIAASTAKHWRHEGDWPAIRAIDPTRFIQLVPRKC